MPNTFDLSIIRYFNQYSHRSPRLDYLMNFLSENNFTQAAILVMILWWFWFRHDEERQKRQGKVLITLFSCFVSLLLSRILAKTLPMRTRPLYLPEIHFILPYGVDTSYLEGWNSFPSDHAVLFYALATGLALISKRAGIVAFIYTTLFSLLPRIYLGLHYPTDIIAGGVVGTLITLGLNKALRGSNILQKVLRFSERRPQLFYPLFFLVTFQVSELFISSRGIFTEVLRFFSPR